MSLFFAVKRRCISFSTIQLKGLHFIYSQNASKVYPKYNFVPASSIPCFTPKKTPKQTKQNKKTMKKL